MAFSDMLKQRQKLGIFSVQVRGFNVIKLGNFAAMKTEPMSRRIKWFKLILANLIIQVVYKNNRYNVKIG